MFFHERNTEGEFIKIVR
jgi:TatD DNase family protein